MEPDFSRMFPKHFTSPPKPDSYSPGDRVEYSVGVSVQLTPDSHLEHAYYWYTGVIQEIADTERGPVYGIKRDDSDEQDGVHHRDIYAFLGEET